MPAMIMSVVVMIFVCVLARRLVVAAVVFFVCAHVLNSGNVRKFRGGGGTVTKFGVERFAGAF